MRTAKEVLEDYNGFFPEYVHEAMIQYAKEACLEQKGNVCQRYTYNSGIRRAIIKTMCRGCPIT
jgi:hypothetical protein